MRTDNGALARLSDPAAWGAGSSVPSAIEALSESGLVAHFVAYEAAPMGRIAATCSSEGGAEATMTRERIIWREGARSRSEPLSARPLQQLGALLETLSSGRTAFGYLGFELAYLLHALPARLSSDQVIAHFIIPEVELRWTEEGREVIADEPAVGRAIAGLCDEAATERTPPGRTIDVERESDRVSYETRVSQVLERIRLGRLRKAIVSRTLEVPFAVNLAATYRVGRRLNTPARSFLFHLGETSAMGFSPEIVTSVGPDGWVSTEPLAGTRPFGIDPRANRRWREDLFWDPKECYEHVISVRLAAEELTRVCDPCTVMVKGLLDVRERGSVQHFGSQVLGRISPPSNRWNVLEQVFPAVTASGIPKRPALETICDVETQPRDVYAGAVCVVEPDGRLDAALVLRSVFQRRGKTWLQAGAGIVEQSDPTTEFLETAAKMRSVAGCLVPVERHPNQGDLGQAGLRHSAVTATRASYQKG